MNTDWPLPNMEFNEIWTIRAKGDFAYDVEELERVEFRVTWDGTFGQRILIAPFDWKKK